MGEEEELFISSKVNLVMCNVREDRCASSEREVKSYCVDPGTNFPPVGSRTWGQASHNWLAGAEAWNNPQSNYFGLGKISNWPPRRISETVICIFGFAHPMHFK